MSTDSDDDTSGAGCLLILGMIAIGIGCGYLWGRAIGWLVIGVACIALSTLSTWSARRQRQK